MRSVLGLFAFLFSIFLLDLRLSTLDSRLLTTFDFDLSTFNSMLATMRPPRKLATEEQFYAAALRALMRRAHSVYEMRQALERRLPTGPGGEEKVAVRRVLQRLKNEKLLDDARYSRQFARYR